MKKKEKKKKKRDPVPGPLPRQQFLLRCAFDPEGLWMINTIVLPN